MLQLLFILIAKALCCPCFFQNSQMLCEAFHCKWQSGNCIEMKCSDRSVGDCLTLNAITLQRKNPIFCQLVKTTEGIYCASSPRNCELLQRDIDYYNRNCNANFCNMNLATNECENFPNKCIEELCQYKSYYIYENFKKVGICQNPNCELIKISHKCEENVEQKVCTEVPFCKWKNSTCAQLHCEERKECNDNMLIDEKHSCVKRQNKCQVVEIEDLKYYECFDNGFMHYFEKEEKCMSCAHQQFEQGNEQGSLEYYEDQSDLDDQVINLEIYNRIGKRDWSFELILIICESIYLLNL